MWWQQLHRRYWKRPQTPRQRGVRLSLECLEDRLTPSNFAAATVSDLIADINAANLAGGSNTIMLTASATSPYVLTAVDNTTNGANGLPVIAKKDTLTIIGNGDTIERSTASGTLDFRIFDVAKGGSLILESLTLQNGLAFAAGSSAEGGAIYNQGTLDLKAVTVQNNTAKGQQGKGGWGPARTATAGASAAGGGIYSSGTLTLEGGTILQNNQAVGGNGGKVFSLNGDSAQAGGNGFGGGLYVSGGTATLTNVTVSSNIALGGGGIYFPGPGKGEGGGLYIDPAAAVSLDAFTVANVINNTTSSSDPNIHGSYNPIP